MFSLCANWILKHPKKIIFISILFALFSLVHASLYLQLDTNQDNLISNELDYQKNYLAFLDEFGDQEYIYVVAQSPRRAQTIAALTQLSEKLSIHSKIFLKIELKEDVSQLKKRGLLLLEEQEYQKIKKTLKAQHPFFTQYAKNPKLTNLFSLIISQIKDLEKSQTPSQSSQDSFEFFEHILLNLDSAQAMRAIENQKLFSTKQSQTPFDQEGYFRSGNLYLLKVLPKKNFDQSNIIEVPLKILRETITQINQDYPQVEIGMTGRPVLQNDEMNSASSDSYKVGIISFLGIACLFFLFFRSFRRPLFALVSLALGLAWTLGFVSIAIGHLNLLTLVFAIILMGLGIDYGIHFLIAYQNELHKSKSLALAIQHSLKHTGKAIFIGGISSSLAFFMALFSNFLGLQELGIVAGTGVLLCLLSQIFTFPAFLVLLEQKTQAQLGKKPIHFPYYPRLLSEASSFFSYCTLSR